MNKSTLATNLKETFPKDIASQAAANRIVDYVFDSIIKATAEGEEVVFAGFGSFSKSDRSARKGRNPQTGEEVTIPAKTVPKFKAGKKFKEAIK